MKMQDYFFTLVIGFGVGVTFALAVPKCPMNEPAAEVWTQDSCGVLKPMPHKP